MKKEINMYFKGKTLDFVFDSQNKTVFELYCKEVKYYDIYYNIDLADIIKCILFNDVSPIKGEWSEEKVKRLFKVLE